MTRTQLNIKINPDLLVKIKELARRQGKTLSEFVVEILEQAVADRPISLEARLERIEQHLGID